MVCLHKNRIRIKSNFFNLNFRVIWGMGHKIFGIIVRAAMEEPEGHYKISKLFAMIEIIKSKLSTA